jgi:hypothetical protein
MRSSEKEKRKEGKAGQGRSYLFLELEASAVVSPADLVAHDLSVKVFPSSLCLWDPIQSLGRVRFPCPRPEERSGEGETSEREFCTRMRRKSVSWEALSER